MSDPKPVNSQNGNILEEAPLEGVRKWTRVKSIVHDFDNGGEGKTTYPDDKLGEVLEAAPVLALLAAKDAEITEWKERHETVTSTGKFNRMTITELRNQLEAEDVRIKDLRQLLYDIAPSWLPEEIRERRRKALGGAK